MILSWFLLGALLGCDCFFSALSKSKLFQSMHATLLSRLNPLHPSSASASRLSPSASRLPLRQTNLRPQCARSPKRRAMLHHRDDIHGHATQAKRARRSRERGSSFPFPFPAPLPLLTNRINLPPTHPFAHFIHVRPLRPPAMANPPTAAPQIPLPLGQHPPRRRLGADQTNRTSDKRRRRAVRDGRDCGRAGRGERGGGGI